VRIDEELVEIWPNEVCDTIILLRKEHLQVMEKEIQEQIKKIQTREQAVMKLLEKKDEQS